MIATAILTAPAGFVQEDPASSDVYFGPTVEVDTGDLELCWTENRGIEILPALGDAYTVDEAEAYAQALLKLVAEARELEASASKTSTAEVPC